MFLKQISSLETVEKQDNRQPVISRRTNGRILKDKPSSCFHAYGTFAELFQGLTRLKEQVYPV